MEAVWGEYKYRGDEPPVLSVINNFPPRACEGEIENFWGVYAGERQLYRLYHHRKAFSTTTTLEVQHDGSVQAKSFISRLLASCIVGTSRLPRRGYIDESSSRVEGHSPSIRSHPPRFINSPTLLPWPCSDDRSSRGRTMTPSTLQTSPTLDLLVLYPHHRGCIDIKFDLCTATAAAAAYPAATAISRDRTCDTTHLVPGSPKKSDCNIWQAFSAVRRSPGGTLRLKGRRPCPRPSSGSRSARPQLGASLVNFNIRAVRAHLETTSR